MNWKYLNNLNDLDLIKKKSTNNPVLIFKHSTICSISQMVLSRFEREWGNINFEYYFLDLLDFRNVSNAIADDFNIEHQSPQVLIIKDRKCVETASHNAINSIDLAIYTNS